MSKHFLWLIKDKFIDLWNQQKLKLKVWDYLRIEHKKRFLHVVKSILQLSVDDDLLQGDIVSPSNDVMLSMTILVPFRLVEICSMQGG